MRPGSSAKPSRGDLLKHHLKHLSGCHCRLILGNGSGGGDKKIGHCIPWPIEKIRVKIAYRCFSGDFLYCYIKATATDECASVQEDFERTFAIRNEPERRRSCFSKRQSKLNTYPRPRWDRRKFVRVFVVCFPLYVPPFTGISS
jgi:hypothetical protein